MSKLPIADLAWGGGIIALALAATLARRLGYIDGDTVIRLAVGVNGPMIAYYGNRMPKAFAPRACDRQVNRVGGWAMVLSGLVYVGLFAAAPIPAAVAIGSGAILAGLAVTFGYGLWLRAKADTA